MQGWARRALRFLNLKRFPRTRAQVGEGWRRPRCKLHRHRPRAHPPSPAFIVRGGCVCSESTVVLSHDVFTARGACSRCTRHSQYAPQYAAFHISAFDQLRQIRQDYCTNTVYPPLSKTNIIVTQFATIVGRLTTTHSKL